MFRRLLAVLLLLTQLPAFASAYDSRPKLVVIVIIDQFRGDYLARWHDRFVPDGFRMFTDRGAWFTDCHYDYANLRTAPGHATIGTGAYTDGHGIPGNEWYSYDYDRVLSSVDDPAYDELKGAGKREGDDVMGTSPHNLLASTLGDELKLATMYKPADQRSRVFGVALKDRASILPTGHAADAAYFIDKDDGEWISSSFYFPQLPEWVQKYNASKPQKKYLNEQIKDANGNLTRTTEPLLKPDGTPVGFYDLVGITPYGNDYELDFARALVANEQLSKHGSTDLLVLSLSPYDILGHKVGPDSPELEAMALTLDKQLAGFFQFLDQQVGMSNIWMALSADHGIPPLPDTAAANRIPVLISEDEQNQRLLNQRLNQALQSKLPKDTKPIQFVSLVKWPTAFLDSRRFTEIGMNEKDAEDLTAQLFQEATRIPAVFTRYDLMHGYVPHNDIGTRMSHTYSSQSGWEVIGLQPAFSMSGASGTDHGSGYSYDTHVPLAFYGVPFIPGVYRTHTEVVDLAATLANLLGVNRPTHSIGRVLTEAIQHEQTQRVPAKTPVRHNRSR